MVYVLCLSFSDFRMETMNKVYPLINKLRKKIKQSSGCSYLYNYFDDLVHELDSLERDEISEDLSMAIESLIEDYAIDCEYNTFGSANWVRYSARCFYCADYLTRYLPEPLQNKKVAFLNLYFISLTEAGVAPILPKEIIDKYITIGLKSKAPCKIYDNLIKKAIRESERFRVWDANDVGLALSYLQSADGLLRTYISNYSDYTFLKQWVPILNTKRLANIWYEYPDSANYRHSNIYTREAISKYLDEMLDIHLSIIELWYSNNPQEMIDKLDMEDLIEALEVCDDEDFEKILRHVVTLPYNNKVERILEHFTNDDESWVANLSFNLLKSYNLQTILKP